MCHWTVYSAREYPSVLCTGVWRKLRCYCSQSVVRSTCVDRKLHHVSPGVMCGALTLNALTASTAVNVNSLAFSSASFVRTRSSDRQNVCCCLRLCQPVLEIEGLLVFDQVLDFTSNCFSFPVVFIHIENEIEKNRV